MRFKVYEWTEKEARDYNEDHGIELYEALDDERTNVMGYGTEIGESDDENEALAMTSMDSAISSVWDSKEKYWFN